MSEPDWNSLYSAFKSEKDLREREFEEKSVRLDTLKRELNALECEVKELQVKREKSINSSGHYVTIDWDKFVEYASKSRGMRTFDEKFDTQDNRWWCKYPGCTTGGSRKLDRWDVTYGYSLKTGSHRWRACSDCVGYEGCRNAILTRPVKQQSTRPALGTPIQVDPMAYDDPVIARDILRLAGINVSDAVLTQESKPKSMPTKKLVYGTDRY